MVSTHPIYWDHWDYDRPRKLHRWDFAVLSHGFTHCPMEDVAETSYVQI